MKKIAKPAAGPWEAYLPGRKFVHQARNFKAICELDTYERDSATVDATARLMAAAPELLEVSEAVVSQLRDWNLKNGFSPSPQMMLLIDMAEKAIKKAKEPPDEAQ